MKKRKRKKNIYLLIIIGILIITIFILVYFNKNLNNKIINLGYHKFEEEFYDVINKDVNRFLTSNYDNLNDLITISKNSESKIIMIDYNMKNVYEISQNINKLLGEKIKNTLVKKGNIVFIPLGQVLNSSLFGNLGSKIPLQIKYIGAYNTSISTKVTNYGLNNALLETYLNIRVDFNLLTPMTLNNKKMKYKLLISSKVVNGKVPNMYGSVYQRESELINVLNE